MQRSISFVFRRGSVTRVSYFFTKETVHSSPVHLVTVPASHRTQFVDASSELIKSLQFLMACEADIGLNAGRLTFESKDSPFSFGLCVLLSRAMAGLTILSPSEGSS